MVKDSKNPASTGKTDARYHLYDDPDSQIRFLEMVLGDKEWRAVIHLMPGQDPTALRELRTALQQRGIESRPSTDTDGHHTLRVHHISSEPDIPGLFRTYGLIRGTEYVIRHPMGSASALIGGVQDGIKAAVDYVRDPARANGTIFIAAEAVLLAAGGANKHGKWLTPKNVLQSTAAAFWLSQSLAYAGFARTGDDRIAYDYNERLHAPFSPARLGDNLAAALPINEQPRNSWVEKARGYLEDHPIQAGALLNDIGMLTFMAHAVLERQSWKEVLKHNPLDAKALHYVNKGFRNDIMGCAVSILGWSFLLLPPKERDEKAEGLIEKAWGRMRENPQAVTAMTSIYSSSNRLLGGLAKGNKLQMLGEAMYIPGDLMLFFIHSNEYGISRGGASDKLLDMVGNLMISAPVVASPKAYRHWVEQSADYLTRQYQALSETPIEDPQALKQDMIDGLIKRTEATMSERYDLLIGAAQRFALDHPASDRRQVIATLAETMPKLAGVYTDREEIETRLCQQTNMSSPAMHANVDRNTLARGIGALVMRIPHPEVGQNALKLLRAFTGPQHELPPEMLQALNEQAEKETGISATQLMRNESKLSGQRQVS
ncbi:MAG: hypothetical protein CMM93_05480 [Rickettsiales bacterium]|nr:hypothetical protein [Rickettsiales bacterium]